MLFELEDRTMDALILGFKEPIMEGCTIPSNTMLYDFVEEAVKRTGGRESLQKRVSKGVFGSFSGGRYDTNLADHYLIHNPDVISWCWFYGIGDVFKFKPGEKEKAEKRVKQFWTQKELKNFERVNAITSELSKKYYAGKG